MNEPSDADVPPLEQTAADDDSRPAGPSPAREAVDRLMPTIEAELRRVAQGMLRRERPNHTLQATDLIDEAFVRLAGQRDAATFSRDQFLGLAARMIRRILVDHARKKAAARHGGQHERVPLLDVHEDQSGQPPLDVLALDEALRRLEETDPEKSQLIELRFFGGLTNAETAQAMGVTRRHVDGQWKVARLWLHRELTRGGGGA